jgi:hypothetical protein
LTSGPRVEWELYIRCISQQLNYFIYECYLKNSWNPRAKFVVSVISNCTQFDNKFISTTIMQNLWFYHVRNATVLFLKTN